MRHFLFAMVMAASTLTGLAACGGGGGAKATNPDSVMAISRFQVAGSSSTSSPVEVSPSIGEFPVAWTVDSDVDYQGELFVSTDAVLNESSDVRFFAQQCGTNTSCSEQAQISCRFDNSNILSCGASAGLDLTGFLVGLPMNAYIILQVCENATNRCANRAVLVQFQ